MLRRSNLPNSALAHRSWWGLGGVERTLELQRGIMQGSAFSADVFSRMMDWALKPQAVEMETLFPSWSELVQGIPHFLIYAGDPHCLCGFGSSLAD